MEKSLETILKGVKHCQRVKCLDCPYKKIETTSCNYALLADCAEMLRLQAEIIKDAEAEINRLKNEIPALNEENEKLRTELSHREQDLIHATEKVFYRESNVAFCEYKIKQQAVKDFSMQLQIKIGKINNRPYDRMSNFEFVDMLDAECEMLLKEFTGDIKK